MKKFKIMTFILCTIFLLFGFFAETLTNARIDIVNTGSLENDVKIETSKDIKKGHYHDYNYNAKENHYLEIPNSFLLKNYEIRIKAVKDGNLKIYLRSAKTKDGLSKIITYKNVEINEKEVYHKLAKISYDNSVIINLPVKNNEEIKINFSSRTKLMSEYYIFYIFMGLLLIIFMFIPQKENDNDKNDDKNISYKNEDKKATIEENNFNILEILREKYTSINELYKKTFWIIFIAINFVFIFHTTSFMWGNHGLIALNFKTTIGNEIWFGRYAADIIKSILCSGHYIPVLSNVLSFIGIALSSIILCIYWKVPKKLHTYLIIGLLYALQPFILEWMYYSEGMPDIFYAPLYAILGLFLAEQAYFNYKNKRKFIINTLFSIILLNLAIATYPSTINTIAVVFLGKLFIEFLNFDGTYRFISSIIKKYSVTITSILTAGVIFKAVLEYIKHSGKLSDFYVIEQLSLSEMPKRFLECIKASIVQLYNYKYIFMPHITDIFSILLILLIAYILFIYKNKEQNIFIKLTQLSLLLVVLIFTKAAIMIAAKPLFFEPRIDYFGLMFFRLLIISALFITVRNLNIKNFILLLSVIAIAISTINDMEALRVWKNGKDAEIMLWNRYLSRIESLENFDVNKKYKLIQFGNSLTHRQNFCKEKMFWSSTEGLLSYNYDPNWYPFFHIAQFYTKNFVKESYNTIYTEDIIGNKEKIREIKEVLNSGILKNAQEWPKQNSIIIFNNIIILILDKDEIKRIENIVNKENE